MKATGSASRGHRGGVLGAPWQGWVGCALFLAWGTTLRVDRDAWWHWVLGGAAVAWFVWGAVARRKAEAA